MPSASTLRDPSDLLSWPTGFSFPCHSLHRLALPSRDRLSVLEKLSHLRACCEPRGVQKGKVAECPRHQKASCFPSHLQDCLLANYSPSAWSPFLWLTSSNRCAILLGWSQGNPASESPHSVGHQFRLLVIPVHLGQLRPGGSCPLPFFRFIPGKPKSQGCGCIYSVVE